MIIREFDFGNRITIVSSGLLPLSLETNETKTSACRDEEKFAEEG